MFSALQIIPHALLPDYLAAHASAGSQVLSLAFQELKDAEISSDTFSFYTSVSAVYSSRIEGEDIALDSYVKHKKYGIAFQPDYTRKIDDLYDAYAYAAVNSITPEMLAEAHRILSRHLLAAPQQGRLRRQPMVVTTPEGRIEYVAASPYELADEMEKFHADIAVLLRLPMDAPTAFYFAAMVHLVFVKIHPWNDGNGRCGRLLEKWFLAAKLGGKAWFLPTEQHYYNCHAAYYQNIRRLGLEYAELDYSESLPFLGMAVAALLEVGRS
jgi:Fic family protein